MAPLVFFCGAIFGLFAWTFMTEDPATEEWWKMPLCTFAGAVLTMAVWISLIVLSDGAHWATG